MSFRETRDLYLGLKPKGKEGQLDTELRLVQFNNQYNDYNQEHDDNFELSQPYNEERSVEFNCQACNTHTEKRLWWGSADGFERKLLSLDTRQWVKGDVEGPEQYPEGLEKKFRDFRMFALDDLVKEAPEPDAPWDQLVKNGKYLADTQLKYVLAHLGLLSHALVNAPVRMHHRKGKEQLLKRKNSSFSVIW